MISVVVPAYNAARHIERCLESIRRQTFEEFEVIVVDDGSRDDTAAIVGRWPDPRVRLVRQQNQGVSAARNRGIDEARGEWIAFLDADDEWLPEFLQKASRAANDHPDCIAVFTNFVDSSTKKPVIPKLGGAPCRLESYFDFVLETRQGMWSSCVLIKREALLAIGGFPVGVTHGEDGDTWVRLAWSGPVVYVPEALAVYHTETPGSAMKAPAKKRAVYPQIVRTFEQWKKDGRIPPHMLDASERYIQRYLYMYVSGLLLSGARREARRVLTSECRPGAWRSKYVQFLVGSYVPAPLYRAIHSLLR